MKIMSYVLMIIALGLIIFNATKINLDDPLTGDSQVAVIGILASACVIVLLLILNTSLLIKKKQK